MKKGISLFPDLIFEHILNERVDKILKIVNSGSGLKQKNIELDRATVFVTHRCNLRCIYCNGPHLNTAVLKNIRKKMLSADMPLALFKKLLNEWKRHKLKYLHFTGGEATLHPLLPEFIRLSKEKGIITSITTNGTADVGLMNELLASGLYEIRISIDGYRSDDVDGIVGVPGTFEKVIRNIKNLTHQRDKENKNIFIILNATIGTYNIDKIQSMLEFLLKFKPNDIKFLVVAEQEEQIQNHSSREAVNRLLHFIESSGHNMPLLTDKIRHLFRKNIYGLKTKPSQYIMNKCFIPLTERTVDANGIYPCSIYLRYYGPPLIKSSASFAEQQKAIVSFIEENECIVDDICVNNCTRCTRDFNIELNKRLRDFNATEKDKELYVSTEAIDPEFAEKSQKIYENILLSPEVQEIHVMIVKPESTSKIEEITAYLKEQKVGPIKLYTIKDWSNFSLFLYAKFDREPVLSDIRFYVNQAHNKIQKEHAVLIILDAKVPLKKLIRIKKEIRAWFGTTKLNVFLPDGRKISIFENNIHSPDEKRIIYESKVIQKWFDRGFPL